MNAGPFDEFDDRFEDEETWLDDFDDRDASFDATAEAAILDDSGIDWTTFEGRTRPDLGINLGTEDDDDADTEDEIAA